MAENSNLTKDSEATGYAATENPPPYTNQGADVPPPSYDDSQYPQEAPPSYTSLYGQVKDVHHQSSGVADFLKKLSVIILSTIGCTICIGIVLAIPIAMIVIGARYMHECPAERYIPIYLVVGGAFGVLKNLSSVAQRIRNRQENQDEENAKTNPFDGIITCFLLAWFIAGNVWVYRLHAKGFNHEDPNSSDYCHPTVFWFAFWIITATYILIGTICFCVCCVGCVSAIFGKGENSQS